MVFTPLCRGNQVCIISKYRHGMTIVNNKIIYRDINTFKISRYIAKTIILLSPTFSPFLIATEAHEYHKSVLIGSCLIHMSHIAIVSSTSHKYLLLCVVELYAA